MGYVDILKKSIAMLKLDQQAMVDISNDESATGWAFLTVALAGVASALGTFDFLDVIINPVIYVGLFLVVFLILHGLAKLFGGQASMSQFLRPLGNLYVVMWISVIPFLGSIVAFLASIWTIVVEVVVVMAVHKLSTGKAIAVILIPVAVFVVLALLFVVVFAALFSGLFLAGAAV